MKILCVKGKNKAEENSMERLYEKAHKTIEGWPDWKKQAYNDNFAVSRYSQKLVIKGK